MTKQTPADADGWLEAIHEQFDRESDRAAAIVAASMLDNALTTLIRRLLVSPLSAERSLLDGGDRAPLGTFSARIDAAHQLGLISPYMARDLHLLRKIRNAFAHDPLHITFDSPEVRDRIRALAVRSQLNHRESASRQAVGPPGMRWDFLSMAAWMLYALHTSVDAAKPLTAHLPEFGYIDYAGLDAQIQKLLKDVDS